MPPGTQFAHLFLREQPAFNHIRKMVVSANTNPKAKAHSGILRGSPFPVTRRAVYIHTYPVGTLNVLVSDGQQETKGLTHWNRSPGIL
jgi:hypothetical protein